MAEHSENRPAIDWPQVITANWELINRLARRRFGTTTLAEEAALAVLERLLEDTGDRLQGYGGRAPIPAFLAAVSWRLLEDFARNRYGRRRPPLWIRQLGGYWEKLYILLCLERLELLAAVESIGQRQRHIELREIEDAAWAIRQQVVDCGTHQGLEVELDEALAVGQDEEEVTIQVARLEQRERVGLFRQLFQALTGCGEEQAVPWGGKLAALRLALTAEERLLLQLCYVDEVPVAQAGAMLGLNRFQVHGRLRRLLARLRRELAAAGIEQDIRELLR
jgi:Sigma-70, region 4